MTDAPASYTDQVIVSFDPPIITETSAKDSRKVITNGRGGFWIKMQDEQPLVGHTVTVNITIKSSVSTLTDSREYAIMPKKRGKQQIKITRPEVRPHVIRPSDPHWSNMQHDPKLISADKVAFNVQYDRNGGQVHIWINENFGSYRELSELLLKKKLIIGVPMLDKRYVRMLCIHSFPMIEAESIPGVAELDATVFHHIKAAEAKTMLFTLYAEIVAAGQSGTLDDDYKAEINMAA